MLPLMFCSGPIKGLVPVFALFSFQWW